ncbi:5'-nucleotidase C-terminal domain-containing protein [Belliella marina]|uniref:5'-nucleotidase C-terminal domain-containing protein n=1 Tax=Belliella marina TaxID=1644146 RepID=A0ABW4VUH6_9BACT
MIKYHKTTLLHLALLCILATSCKQQLHYQYQGGYEQIDGQAIPDPETQTFVNPYKEEMEAEMNQVIGESSISLTKGQGESLLGNFVTNIQKEFAEETYGYQVDISLMNNGGMRNELPEGAITLGHIYELSPFDNYLVILELQAADVKNLAEFIARRKNMAIQGLSVVGLEDELLSFQINGKEVMENQTYLLVINDYLANGGDDMEFLAGLPKKEDSNILLRDMLINMIKKKTGKGEKLYAQIEGRQIHN